MLTWGYLKSDLRPGIDDALGSIDGKGGRHASERTLRGPTVTGAACPKFPMEVTGGKPVGAIGRLKFDVDAISFCF